MLVRGLDGRTLCIDREQGSGLFSLKERLSSILGLPPPLLRLVVGGRELDEKRASTLAHGELIDVRLALRGGGNCVGRVKKMTFSQLATTRLDVQSTQILLEELEERTHLGDILERNPDLPYTEAGGLGALREGEALEEEVENDVTPHFFMSVIGFRLVHCYLKKDEMIEVKDITNEGVAAGWRDFEVIFSKVLQNIRDRYKRAVAEEMKNDETKMQLDYALNLSRGFIDEPSQGFHPSIEALHYFVSPFPLLIWNLPKLNFWYDLALAV